ncbi:acyltransferase [Flavobacterium pallidum]|uniref:Capsule biosynthesis protein CapG n=1 Tax=Flavobacterium pallidum TaxID=2172098 RepID=A0A2S1SDK3_9FLAO|nr:acyltransferase [Flavobacterium pallidum]AWI24444.1 capsule biosynthesis protein CapG [Flavobacterium pallidum]
MFKKLAHYYKLNYWDGVRHAKDMGVRMGKGCSIYSRNFGSEPYLIELGDRVQVGLDVHFFTHGASWMFREKHPDFDFFGKIKVGSNVYIGYGSIILPGVTIGSNVLIAAGSVVTKSIPDNSIAGGNPAKVIGSISDLEERIMDYNLNCKKMSRKEKMAFLLSQDDSKFLQK